MKKPSITKAKTIKLTKEVQKAIEAGARKFAEAMSGRWADHEEKECTVMSHEKSPVMCEPICPFYRNGGGCDLEERSQIICL